MQTDISSLLFLQLMSRRSKRLLTIFENRISYLWKRRGDSSAPLIATSGLQRSAFLAARHLAIVGLLATEFYHILSRMADHFGVVKALLDANLLPRVIAGTSCGSLIAAFVCTRTDGELRTLLNPSLAKRITACEEPFRNWFRRFLQTGARFDTVDWARKVSNVR
jgi:hypothetical protein